jgi:hypothetical protein
LNYTWSYKVFDCETPFNCAITAPVSVPGSAALRKISNKNFYPVTIKILLKKVFFKTPVHIFEEANVMKGVLGIWTF